MRLKQMPQRANLQHRGHQKNTKRGPMESMVVTGLLHFKTLHCLLFSSALGQVPIDSLTRNKLVMIPTLSNAATLEHKNDVRILDGAQPVRDSNRGSALLCSL